MSAASHKKKLNKEPGLDTTQGYSEGKPKATETSSHVQGDSSTAFICLQITEGNDSGKTFFVPPGENQYLLGRAKECFVSVNDPACSRLHAEMQVDAQKRIWIKDLSSTNGVRVNGKKIGTDPYELRDGDMVLLGKTLMLSLRVFGNSNSIKNFFSDNPETQSGLAPAVLFVDRVQDAMKNSSQSFAVGLITLKDFSLLEQSFHLSAAQAAMNDLKQLIRKPFKDLPVYAFETSFLGFLVSPCTEKEIGLFRENLNAMTQRMTEVEGRSVMWFPQGLLCVFKKGDSDPKDILSFLRQLKQEIVSTNTKVLRKTGTHIRLGSS